MNSEPALDYRSLSTLSDQFEGLLSFLRQKEEAWLSSKFQELSGLPDELEYMVSKLASSVAGLRAQVQNSGRSSLREWIRQDPARENEATRLLDSLKQRVQQTKQLAQVQQLLARNLLAYSRGAAILSESRQNPTYSGVHESSMRARRLEIRG
jgi:hypothetical protein